MPAALVHPRLLHHPVTQRLSRRRVGVEAASSGSLFDYRCGHADVLVVDYTTLESSSGRDGVRERVGKLRQASDKPIVAMLVWMSTVDPALDTLSWLNLDCGIAVPVSVVLCWSVEELVQCLETFCTAAVVSTEYAYGAKPKESTPLPSLVEALTQTPQFLSRTDIIRMANRGNCVADVLSCAPGAFETIPGIGSKKMARLHALLNAPFLSSQQSVTDVLAMSRGAERPGAGANTTAAAIVEALAPTEEGAEGVQSALTSTALTDMRAALLRRRQQEDEQDEEN